MKNSIRKLTALVLVLAMVLSMSALAAKQTPSKGFRLPAVKPRVTEAPADASGAADAPAAPEATEAPAVPEETQVPEAGETPAPAEEETVIGSAYVSLEDASSTLNVRAAATTDSQRLGSLNHGDRVSVLGYEGEWTKIAYGSAFGFVKSSFLSASPAEEEPVEEPTEEPTEEPVEEPTEEPVEEPVEEPAEEPTEAPVEVPTEAPAEEPVEEPVEEPTEEPAEEIDLAGLRQIIVVLREGETSLKLYAEANTGSEVLATIGAGEMLYVQNIEAEWSYAVYGEVEGYVLTEKIALFNETATPEEEEIIRTVNVSSNVASDAAVYAGTEIVLSAKLTGFENVAYTLQWQYTPDGGETICDVPGANDAQYAFIIDDSNAHYLWRVSVTIAAEATEQAGE